MTTVVVSVPRVVDHPNVGGHFWEYMQYAQGLRRAGCEVWWTERVSPTGDPSHGVDEAQELRVALFMQNIRPFGLSDRVILYEPAEPRGVVGIPWRPLNTTPARAREVVRRADLLINFDYAMDPELVSMFRRSALMDIDPGLLQFWIHQGQLRPAPHDVYFTTGETVGTPHARFPDCGLSWVRIPPALSLDLWPYCPGQGAGKFTTVSSWWADEWITDGLDFYENNKRVTFLEFWDLPRRSRQAMELALYLGPGDAEDVARLRSGGWTVRRSADVARTPEAYRRYIQGSRGEFSCVKPSCIHFSNAWVSDRTLCYLASGKPAIVQDTGPSRVLPNGEGIFRFSTMEEAVAAVSEVNADYERHSRAARELVEGRFEAESVARKILDVALAESVPGRIPDEESRGANYGERTGVSPACGSPE